MLWGNHLGKFHLTFKSVSIKKEENTIFQEQEDSFSMLLAYGCLWLLCASEFLAGEPVLERSLEKSVY